MAVHHHVSKRYYIVSFRVEDVCGLLLDSLVRECHEVAWSQRLTVFCDETWRAVEKAVSDTMLRFTGVACMAYVRHDITTVVCHASRPQAVDNHAEATHAMGTFLGERFTFYLAHLLKLAAEPELRGIGAMVPLVYREHLSSPCTGPGPGPGPGTEIVKSLTEWEVVEHIMLERVTCRRCSIMAVAGRCVVYSSDGDGGSGSCPTADDTDELIRRLNALCVPLPALLHPNYEYGAIILRGVDGEDHCPMSVSRKCVHTDIQVWPFGASNDACSEWLYGLITASGME